MKRTLLFILMGLVPIFSGFAQSDLQPAATVNLIRSEVITVKQLRTEIERLEQATGRAFNQTERLQVLDNLINERLTIQAAERDRITITENEVNQQIQQMRGILAQQLNRQPTDAEFNQAVRNEFGMDTAAFREHLRRQMTIQKYLMTKKEEQIRSWIKIPTNEEVETQYNLSRTSFVRPEMIRFSAIQVPYGADAASRTRARELVDRLYREIGSNPSRFDEYVARSQSPNSGYMAGDGGYIPRNADVQTAFGPTFMNIAFSIRQGEVSQVIEAVPGYLIIKVTENYAMRNLELDDIMLPGNRETVRERIYNTLLSRQQEAALTRATEELIADLRRGNPFTIFRNNLNW
jgi:parvulin-like peptidyl-prolyl isomerase